MREWTLARIAEQLGGRLVGPDAPLAAAVVTDSRQIERGGLYVARVGENTDGHRFLPDVAAAGAAGAIVTDAQAALAAGLGAVVVSDATEALGRLAKAHLEALRRGGRIRVVGITGSAGKTTTKDLLAQILSAHGPTVAPQKSFNNEVGMPLTVLRADTDTRYLVLEMGASGPGHLRYLTGIAAPDIAVELMVGRAHLGGFGTVEALARAKAELVEGLAPGGVALLNADDEAVSRMAALVRPPQRVARFSLAGAPADFAATDVTVDGENRPRLRVEDQSVRVDLVGAHHAANALAAYGVARLLGISAPAAAEALADAHALSEHRMAVTRLDDDIVVIDDAYNANPDSLRAGVDALASLAASRPGRRVLLLGQMLELGEESARLHREAAEYARGRGVTDIVTLGEGARVIADAVHAADPQHALALIDELVGPGDTLLIKGSNSSLAWKVAASYISRKEGQR